MSFTFFFSFLIFIGSISFILVIVQQLTKSVKWIKGSQKISVAFISVYILVGVVAMVAMGQQQSTLPILSDSELMTLNEEQEKIYNAIDRAAYTEIDDKYIEETWEFELQGDTILINYPHETNGNFPVFVEQRSEGDDPSVYVTYYKTPHSLRGMDVTKYVKAPTITFEQDTFSVTEWGHSELQFRQVLPRISIIDVQYDLFEIDNLRDWNYGQRVLYLNIPKDVHIIDTSIE